MQQTETYKLNKPETTDPFTPAPLNENADKLEAALLAETAARQALDGRVQVLELHRVVTGLCGGAYGNTINLGFQPKAVVAMCATGTAVALPGASAGGSGGVTLVTVNENGFSVGGDMARAGRYLALF